MLFFELCHDLFSRLEFRFSDPLSSIGKITGAHLPFRYSQLRHPFQSCTPVISGNPFIPPLSFLFSLLY